MFVAERMPSKQPYGWLAGVVTQTYASVTATVAILIAAVLVVAALFTYRTFAAVPSSTSTFASGTVGV